jgi:alkanesulfonate monooxygenase SsuD/methylene tetrahydromethanopterin reductase-like flavin-dependent oxidoreductase (luciferase family)
VCPSENAEVVREAAKFLIAAYLNVEVYAKFHEWLGRGPRLQGMWDAWQAGDRKAALAAIPDSVVDEIVVHGSLAKCRETIERYYANGVTTTSLTIVPLDPAISYWDSIIGLSPSAS